jgi:hypothetical protein
VDDDVLHAVTALLPVLGYTFAKETMSVINNVTAKTAHNADSFIS